MHLIQQCAHSFTRVQCAHVTSLGKTHTQTEAHTAYAQSILFPFLFLFADPPVASETGARLICINCVVRVIALPVCVCVLCDLRDPYRSVDWFTPYDHPTSSSLLSASFSCHFIGFTLAVVTGLATRARSSSFSAFTNSQCCATYV